MRSILKWITFYAIFNFKMKFVWKINKNIIIDWIKDMNNCDNLKMNPALYNFYPLESRLYEIAKKKLHGKKLHEMKQWLWNIKFEECSRAIAINMSHVMIFQKKRLYSFDVWIFKFQNSEIAIFLLLINSNGQILSSTHRK